MENSQPGSVQALPPVAGAPGATGEGVRGRLVASMRYEVKAWMVEEGEEIKNFELPLSVLRVGPFTVAMAGERIDVFYHSNDRLETKTPERGDVWTLIERVKIEMGEYEADIAYTFAPLRREHVAEDVKLFTDEIISTKTLDYVVLTSPDDWTMTFDEFFVGEGESPQFVIVCGKDALVFWISIDGEGIFDYYRVL